VICIILDDSCAQTRTQLKEVKLEPMEEAQVVVMESVMLKMEPGLEEQDGITKSPRRKVKPANEVTPSSINVEKRPIKLEREDDDEVISGLPAPEHKQPRNKGDLVKMQTFVFAKILFFFFFTFIISVL
jgi:hypothetical protein